MNRRNLFRGLLATVAALKIGKLPAAPVVPPVWDESPTTFAVTPQGVYQINFFKNGKWMSGTNPHVEMFDPVKWAMPMEENTFKPGDVMSIDVNFDKFGSAKTYNYHAR